MLDVLVASRPQRQAGLVEYATSSVFHVGLIALCVVGTRAAARPVTERAADTTLLFLPRLTQVETERPAPPPPGRDPAQLIISGNPPPRGFQLIATVASIPTEVPPVDLGQKAIDPRDFTGRGVEGGVGWGVEGGTGPVDSVVDGSIRELLYRAETNDVRFVRAELLVQPAFRFPVVMRDAGISGRVVMEFVIDTLGRVEKQSVRVLEQTNQAFGQAAQEGLLLARFEPARFGDRPVRQLSRWPLQFRLESELAQP